MIQNKNRTIQERPDAGRILDAPILSIDLLAYIFRIRKEKAWKESDRNAITVFKSNVMRIVIIALHKEAEMINHSVEGMTSIQVLEGTINLRSANACLTMDKGQVAVLHDGIEHSVEAKKEAVFLLTISKSIPVMA